MARRLRISAAALLVAALVFGGLEALLHLRPGLLPAWYRDQLPVAGIELRQPGLLARTPIEGYPVPGAPGRYVGPPPADLVQLGLVDPAHNPDVERLPRVEIALDEKGFPNERVPERADVVLLGDSFAVSAGMLEPPGLCRELARRTGLSVYDVGVPGLGPTREVWLLEKEGLPLAPRHVVWLLFGGNDVDDEARLEDSVGSGVRTWADLPEYVRPPVVRSLDLALTWVFDPRPARSVPPPPVRGVTLAAGPDAGVPVWFAPRHLQALALDAGRWREQRGFPGVQRALSRARFACETSGARLLVVFVPSKAQVLLPLLGDQRDALFAMATFGESDAELPLSADQAYELGMAGRASLEQVLAETCGELGIAFLSATPFLEAQAARGELGYLCADTHWTHAGQGVLAEPLARALVDGRDARD